MVGKLATFVFTMVGLTWAARPSTDSFEESLIAVGREPASVAVADLNHDGKLDIVVANTGSESISVLNGGWKRKLPTVAWLAFSRWASSE